MTVVSLRLPLSDIIDMPLEVIYHKTLNNPKMLNIFLLTLATTLDLEFKKIRISNGALSIVASSQCPFYSSDSALINFFEDDGYQLHKVLH